MLLAQVFLTLKELAKELRGMRNAGAKVIKRWHRLGLSNGFYGCSEHAATQKRMAEKFFLQWQNTYSAVYLAPAMTRWAAFWNIKKSLQRTAGISYQFLRVSKGFCWWNEHAADQRRLGLAAIEIVLRTQAEELLGNQAGHVKVESVRVS